MRNRSGIRDMENCRSSPAVTSSFKDSFNNQQNLSTSPTPTIACMSVSALQQSLLSCGWSSTVTSPPTSCNNSGMSTNSCPCSSSSLNSLIPSPFSCSSFTSFFPAHVARQCSFVPCSSSCASSPSTTSTSSPSVSMPPLIQPRRRRRSDRTLGTYPSSSSSEGVALRLSSLASLASAVQAFSLSHGKGFVDESSGERDTEEAELIGGGGERKKQQLGMRNGLVTAAVDSQLSSRVANFFQQLPGEVEGFRRSKFGLAASSWSVVGGFKRRREIESLKAQLPDDDKECAVSPKDCNELKDCVKERKEIITATKLQREKKKKKKVIQTSQHLLAGAVAAMVSRTIVAPLERLKLEYLVRGAQGSVLSTVQRILKNEGVVGFWKGNGMNLLRTAPFKSVNFFCYDAYRNQLLKFGHKRKDVTNLERLAAGAAAGVTATILCFPLDTIRTTMVAQGGEALGGMVGCVKHMIKTEGILSLYKGLLPAVVSMAPSGAVFYGVYDILKIAYLNSPEGKQMLKGRKKRMKEAKERGEEAWVQPELGPVRTLLFGAIAGACAETVTYPFEVIRRAQQLQHAALKLGMTKTFRMLLEKGGVKALYAGIFPSTLQVLPSAAFSYFVYETMKIAFKIP
ncbi:hypothetical protein R1flu_025527 [Riccia fluitans]|uniref:Mitochondrial carrier protein n=1 Tax=Riccia fluitans TaxID=41844 RepID=A0ABD1XY00_9MARC